MFICPVLRLYRFQFHLVSLRKASLRYSSDSAPLADRAIGLPL